MLLLLALGPRLEDVGGEGLLAFGLFLRRRAAAGGPDQEQAAGGERGDAGELAANRRHR
jgi:hypothetical protein